MERRGETDALPVLVVGLGEVGRRVARAVARRSDLRIVGLVDPAHAGTDARELVGDGLPAELVDRPVERPEAAVLRRARGGVALVSTASRVPEILPVLEAAAEAGVNVVTTCEELAYPFLAHPELAERIEAMFAKRKVTCLGTGVNPGFVLDRLAAVLGSVCGEVRHAYGARRVDVAHRRPALQHKVGLGMRPDAFDAAVAEDRLGHVGLVESAALVAEGLGMDPEEVDERIDPVIAEAAFDTGVVRGEAGTVIGIRQQARVFREDKELVRLELEMIVGHDDAGDELKLDADPPLHLRTVGGIDGEEATVWAVVNAAQHVALAEPGLMTVLDLPSGR